MQKHTSFSTGGLFAGLALCLLVLGLGGYALFSGSGDSDVTPQEPELPAAVPTPIPETPVQEEDPAVIPEEPETAASAPAALPEEDPLPVVAEIPRLTVNPLEGEVVTAFSVDQLMYNSTLADWRTHDGVDIAAQEGTAVLAASAGTVRSVTEDTLMGTTVVLDHDGGYQTTYANLQSGPAVRTGDSVSAGESIGAVGSAASAEAAEGPHLHFSVTKDGDPLDPEEFLKH